MSLAKIVAPLFRNVQPPKEVQTETSEPTLYAKLQEMPCISTYELLYNLEKNTVEDLGVTLCRWEAEKRQCLMISPNDANRILAGLNRGETPRLVAERLLRKSKKRHQHGWSDNY